MAGTGRKLFYKIGEICRICGIEPHVLRYWETEFSALSPTKNKAGQRIYREKDLQLVETIKHLLYEEGYTISGANRKIQADGQSSLPLFKKAPRPEQRRILNQIRQELQAILDIVQNDSS
jgi:DNA-binding transcriptional MerR regulator